MTTLKYALYVSVMTVCSCGNNATDKTVTTERENNIKHNQNILTEASWPLNFYSGLIDDKYAFSMMLKSDKGIITGKYFYHSQKRPIDLKGTIKDGQLTLKEYVGNKSTGEWTAPNFDQTSFSGKWQSGAKAFDFQVDSISENDYAKTLNTIKKTTKIKNFESLLALFDLKTLPFNIESAPENDGLDTLTVHTFFKPEFVFETGFGYNEFFPGTHYATDFGHVLVVYHEYTPGAFGINNVFTLLYTFDNAGNIIDSKEIGCFCSDTNMGSNDYYASELTATFSEEGVFVNSMHVHATLFVEELAEGEEEIWEETSKKHNYVISSDGQIEVQ